MNPNYTEFKFPQVGGQAESAPETLLLGTVLLALPFVVQLQAAAACLF